MNQTLNFGVSQRTCCHEHWRFGGFDIIIFDVVHYHTRSPFLHMHLVVRSQVSADRRTLFPFIHAKGTYPMTANIAFQTSRVPIFLYPGHMLVMNAYAKSRGGWQQRRESRSNEPHFFLFIKLSNFISRVVFYSLCCALGVQTRQNKYLCTKKIIWKKVNTYSLQR